MNDVQTAKIEFTAGYQMLTDGDPEVILKDFLNMAVVEGLIDSYTIEYAKVMDCKFTFTKSLSEEEAFPLKSSRLVEALGTEIGNKIVHDTDILIIGSTFTRHHN